MVGIPLQRHQAGVLEGSIWNFSSTKDMGNPGKKYSMETTAQQQQLLKAIDFKVKINIKKTFFNVFFPYNSNRRSEECSFIGKKLVLYKNSSKCVTSRKVKTFFGGMRDTYRGFKNFRNCKRVQDTFYKKYNTGESSPDPTHSSGTRSCNTAGDREHDEDGNLAADRASGWGAFKQYFLGRKTRWGKPACD